jgi:hypothetical protein
MNNDCLKALAFFTSRKGHFCQPALSSLKELKSPAFIAKP